jgi:hypothetical protein
MSDEGGRSEILAVESRTLPKGLASANEKQNVFLESEMPGAKKITTPAALPSPSAS